MLNSISLTSGTSSAANLAPSSYENLTPATRYLFPAATGRCTASTCARATSATSTKYGEKLGGNPSGLQSPRVVMPCELRRSDQERRVGEADGPKTQLKTRLGERLGERPGNRRIEEEEIPREREGGVFPCHEVPCSAFGEALGRACEGEPSVIAPKEKRRNRRTIDSKSILGRERSSHFVLWNESNGQRIGALRKEHCRRTDMGFQVLAETLSPTPGRFKRSVQAAILSRRLGYFSFYSLGLDGTYEDVMTIARTLGSLCALARIPKNPASAGSRMSFLLSCHNKNKE